MLREVKMNLYRLFKSKSYYVVFLVLAMFAALVSYTTVYYAVGETGAETDLLNVMYSYFMGTSVPMIIAIGVGIYVCADYSSGYMKNIASSVSDRGNIAIANFITWTIGVFIYYIGLIFTLYIAALIAGGVDLGDVTLMMKYLGMTYFLNVVLVAMICVVSEFVKKSSTTIVFAVGMYTFFGMLVALADKQLGTKIQDFTNITNYMKIGLDNTNEWLQIGLVGVVYLVIYLGLGYFITRKKDIA